MSEREVDIKVIDLHRADLGLIPGIVYDCLRTELGLAMSNQHSQI